MEIAAKTSAVAVGALDRPGAAAGCVLLGDAKQLAVAVAVRGRRRSGDNSAGGAVTTARTCSSRWVSTPST